MLSTQFRNNMESVKLSYYLCDLKRRKYLEACIKLPKLNKSCHNRLKCRISTSKSWPKIYVNLEKTRLFSQVGFSSSKISEMEKIKKKDLIKFNLTLTHQEEKKHETEGFFFQRNGVVALNWIHRYFSFRFIFSYRRQIEKRKFL